MLDRCVLFLTCDQRNGLAFNNRRQRQNKTALSHMLSRAGGQVCIRACSEDLFQSGDYILFDDLARIPDGKFVFEELGNGWESYGKYGQIILYRWQRNYPGDIHLPHGMLSSYYLEESHDMEIGPDECVTVEAYVKRRGRK